MRIGIDCRLWNETGVGRYTRNLVQQIALLDNDDEYILFILQKDEEEIVDFSPEIKRKITNRKWFIQKANIRWHTLKEQLYLPSILRKKNLDLVHFPYFSVPVFYNKPFVVTIHDLIINHFSTGQASTLPYPLYWLKLQAYKYIIAQAASRAQKVITVSNATKQEVLDHFSVDPSSVVVTYEGIDSNIVVKSGFSCDQKLKNYFLFVGNAYPHKNLEGLLAAFSVLQQIHSSLSLVLIGRNDFFYRKLKEKYKKNTGIHFKTITGDEELACYYKHAKALVMPSFMEGFGLPPLEAMANRCLVIASAIPSLREICDNSAIYFDPKNVSDIVSKMSEVLSLTHEKKIQLLSKGEHRTQLFSWQKMTKETLQVYKSTASKNSV